MDVRGDFELERVSVSVFARYDYVSIQLTSVGHEAAIIDRRLNRLLSYSCHSFQRIETCRSLIRMLLSLSERLIAFTVQSTCTI